MMDLVSKTNEITSSDIKGAKALLAVLTIPGELERIYTQKGLRGNVSTGYRVDSEGRKVIIISRYPYGDGIKSVINY